MKRTLPISDANHARVFARAYARSTPGLPIAPHLDAVIGEALDALEREDAHAAEVRRVAMEALDAVR